MQDNDFLDGMFSLEGEGSPQFIEEDNNLIDDNEDPKLEENDDPAEEITNEGNDDSGDEVITRYIDFLKENDLVEVPEDLSELKGTPEELQAIFDHTKKARVTKTVDSIMGALPEDFKPLFEYALAGGTSLNEFLKVYGEDPIEKANLDDPNSQKAILKEYYQRTTQYTPEKIDRLISFHSDPDDLKEAAEEALDDLKTLKQEEQANFIKQQAERERAEREAAQQRTVELSNSIDNSSSIHPQRKNKVKSFFFEPIQVNNTTTTQFNNVIQTILQNPAHQAQLGDILLEYDAEKGFVMDRLERKVKTKAAQGFRELIEEKLGSKPKPGQSKTTPSKSSINWELFLEQ